MIFEDWSAEELQSEKWEILEVAGPEETWRFEEPEAEADVEDGVAKLKVNPFTRSAETSPFDDFKHFVVSKEPIDVPESGVLTVEVEMVVRCWNNDPLFLRDAMAGFFLRDANSGTVFGAVSNGTLAGAVCANQSPPGDITSFAAVAEAWDRPSPEERHKYTIQYEKNTDKISFWLDKKLFYAVRHIPVKIDQLHLGLAFLTLERAGKPLHEQGAELEVGSIEILET